jgi:hypothetical protein
MHLRASDKPRESDPVTVVRIQKFLLGAHSLLPAEITTEWLARAVVRFDGGPPLDAPRLGPALRQLAFSSVRRRLGARRLRVWLAPAAARPRVGRPRAAALRRARTPSDT